MVKLAALLPVFPIMQLKSPIHAPDVLLFCNISGRVSAISLSRVFLETRSFPDWRYTLVTVKFPISRDIIFPAVSRLTSHSGFREPKMAKTCKVALNGKKMSESQTKAGNQEKL